MKNLVAKAGVAAVTSVLITCLAPVTQVKALEITTTKTGTLVNGTEGGSGDPATNSLVTNSPFAEAGALEVGEFLFNESRAYAEYDLSSIDTSVDDFYNNTLNPITLGFNVFSKGGTGSAGTTGLGNNLGSPFNGTVNVFWYIAPSALDSLAFNPTTPPGGDDPAGAGLVNPGNPFLSIDMSTKNVGDRITVDVSSLVKNLLLTSGTSGNFLGIMLAMDPNSFTGACGGQQRQCVGNTFNNFGISAVPTPAAILPSLFGLGAAAFRKKRKVASVSLAEIES